LQYSPVSRFDPTRGQEPYDLLSVLNGGGER